MMETDNIKQLVHEFKGLYEQRLATLKLDTGGTREDLLQVSTLRSVITRGFLRQCDRAVTGVWVRTPPVLL